MPKHQLHEQTVPVESVYPAADALYPNVDAQIAGYAEVGRYVQEMAVAIDERQVVLGGVMVNGETIARLAFVPPESRLGHGQRRSGMHQGNSLADFREHISSMDRHAAARLDGYLDRTASHFFSRQAARMGSDTGHWKRWLQSVEDPRLINFLEAQLHIISEQQNDPQIIEVVARRKQEFKADVAQGVAHGYLHPDAHKVAAEIDNVRVAVSGLVETVIPGDEAFHLNGSDYVMVRPGAGSDEESRRQDILQRIEKFDKHEYRHIIGYLPDEWLDEAINSHIGAVVAEGRLDVVDPGERSRLGLRKEADQYPHFRTLLATVLERKGVAVSVAYGTLAYTGHRAERQNFKRVVDELWGVPGALAHVNAAVERLAVEHAKQGYSQDRSYRYAATKTAALIRSDPQQVFVQPKTRRERRAGRANHPSAIS